MSIGIIGAMKQEVELIKGMMTSGYQVWSSHKVAYYAGMIDGQSVVLVESGIGKVNASQVATYLINKMGCSLVINTGSAGALYEGLNIGDVVIGDPLTYHDVDVTAFGYELGQMAGMPVNYRSDEGLVSLAQDEASKLGLPVHKGLILSGDRFVSTQELKQELKGKFSGALACDMESAAIAQVCYNHNKPCLIIRSISDTADERASVNFDEFLGLASTNSAQLVLEIIKKIGSDV